MTTDLEQRLREAFREDARQARLVNLEAPVEADQRPPGPHRGTHTARWLVAAAVLIVAGVVGVVLTQTGGDGDREVITSPGRTPRNGSILTGDGDGWPSGAAPPLRPDYEEIVGLPGPTTYSAHDWDGFRPGSGSFLYMSPGPSSRVRVLDGDGEERAAFECESPYCGGRPPVFGPGVDEVTLFMFDDANWADPDGLQVVGWDGIERDTLGIAAAFTRDANGALEQELAELAWSPDGTRLAVATVPKPECDPSQGPCTSQVWTFDRYGGEPQLVYSIPGQGPTGSRIWTPTEIWDLAWAPDGHSLGLVAVPQFLGDPTWPRLDVIRFSADGTIRTHTLHDYRRAAYRPSDLQLVQSDKGATFAFVWSPDGNRIAVAGAGGVAEISAGDGRVLARHRGVGVDDDGYGADLAWLPDD